MGQSIHENFKIGYSVIYSQTILDNKSRGANQIFKNIEGAGTVECSC